MSSVEYERINPEPPTGWNGDHDSAQFRFEARRPLFLKALDYTDTNGAWGGKPLAICKQPIHVPFDQLVDGIAQWRCRVPEIYGTGFLRCAMVLRYDEIGRFYPNTTNIKPYYLEYDFLQNVSSVTESDHFKLIDVERVIPGDPNFKDYTGVRFHKDTLDKFSDVNVEWSDKELTYIAPTIEMVMGGAIIETDDFSIWAPKENGNGSNGNGNGTGPNYQEVLKLTVIGYIAKEILDSL